MKEEYSLDELIEILEKIKLEGEGDLNLAMALMTLAKAIKPKISEESSISSETDYETLRLPSWFRF
jgi:hypothetical protein